MRRQFQATVEMPAESISEQMVGWPLPFRLESPYGRRSQHLQSCPNSVKDNAMVLACRDVRDITTAGEALFSFRCTQEAIQDEHEEYSTMLLRLQNQMEKARTETVRAVYECSQPFDQRHLWKSRNVNTASPTLDPSMLTSTRYVPTPILDRARL